MAATFIDRWIQIVLRMTCQSQQYENTFNYKITSGATPSGSDLQALAQAWWGTAPNPLTAAASNGVQFISVTARDMSSASGAEGTYNIPANTFGSLSGENTPLNACSSISLRSARLGRSGRGRFYWSGLNEAAVNGNSITGSALILLTALGQFYLLFTGTAPVPVTAAVASRHLGQLFTVLSVIVDVFLDSQRRRLTGRGR